MNTISDVNCEVWVKGLFAKKTKNKKTLMSIFCYIVHVIKQINSFCPDIVLFHRVLTQTKFSNE